MAKKKPARISAGLLLYNDTADGLEVFLAHPGGPFWAKRAAGAWSIPKGLVDVIKAIIKWGRKSMAVRPAVRTTHLNSMPYFEVIF
jgi:predicted NUDIX family NTP pyrophosphohydrolase